MESKWVISGVHKLYTKGVQRYRLYQKWFLCIPPLKDLPDFFHKMLKSSNPLIDYSYLAFGCLMTLAFHISGYVWIKYRFILMD